MKTTRREFIVGSLGLTLGGCATLDKGESSKLSEVTPEPLLNKPSTRAPSAVNPLGYKFSNSPEEMKSHYEALIIGSGYGASVMAARLGAKFKDLCILERGKEWHPGDFPDTPYQLEANALKGPLSPFGLIDIERGQDVDIICASGLGGTSLINAAIAIRPEMNVFEQPVWPSEIKEDAKSGKLESYYQLAEKVLQPNPLNQTRFLKSQVHKEDSAGQNKKWGELSLNIRNDSFGAEGEVKKNEFGYPQSACVSCGNCCSGCNYGSKNTLLTNYLFTAKKRGVQIFTQTEVLKIKKQKSGRYTLHLRTLSPASGAYEMKTITADHVFLGAGSKGSTQILMRSADKDFQLSKTLGTRLSANGDFMGISYNTNKRTDSVALTPEQLKIAKDHRPGLIISSYANFRNPSPNNDVMSQFLLLDGVVPSAIAPLVAKAIGHYAHANQNKMYAGLSPQEKQEKMERIKKDLTSLTINMDGALNHSMLYFACGHDSSGGKFVYNKYLDKFDYVWKDVMKESTFVRIEGVMKEYAAKNGGHFIPNPRGTIFGENVQATHPLGGCPMGSDVSKGVVNHLGKVYDAASGGFHENLYVVDAAIIPHSLSATPLLTITALAERIAENILAG